LFYLSQNEELTLELLQEFINKHKQQVAERFDKLKKLYESDHDILHIPRKEKYKPDNRVVVNFPKYMVDTTNGFFIGNAIKTTAEDAAVAEYVDELDQSNTQDDSNAEISKLCSIYGKAYEMYFSDEEGEPRTAYFSPRDCFMIFDDSMLRRPLYFVHIRTDREGNEWGSISNAVGVRYFKLTGGIEWQQHENEVDVVDGWKRHFFPGLPATEFVEDAEKIGLFEPVVSMVNAYNKAISEKANDVDYFADAYLKILGAKVDNEGMAVIRDNRVINFESDGSEKIVVDFLAKPSNDEGQEHLLDRLERLIFCIGQTANAADENFGTNSGIAMLYKMWNTSNRGKNKQRKFEKGMYNRYKMLFGHPASKVPADAWKQLRFTFTPNIPQNVLEEAQIAAQLEGITSHETQLKMLSVVDDPQIELDKIAEENKAPEETIVDRYMFRKGISEEGAE
jgi:SPP1 family phage portal protein